MTAPLYSATIDPLIGYSVEPFFSTQRTPLKAAADVTSAGWDRARYRIKLPYRTNATDAATISNFFEARTGPWAGFDFIDFHSRAWVGVYVTTTTGATVTEFDLPIFGGSYSGTTLYTKGVEEAKPWIGISFSAGTGTNGRDQIVYGGPPAADKVLTVSFTGQRVWANTHFDQESLPMGSIAVYTGAAHWQQFNVALLTAKEG